MSLQLQMALWSVFWVMNPIILVRKLDCIQEKAPDSQVRDDVVQFCGRYLYSPNSGCLWRGNININEQAKMLKYVLCTKISLHVPLNMFHITGRRSVPLHITLHYPLYIYLNSNWSQNTDFCSFLWRLPIILKDPVKYEDQQIISLTHNIPRYDTGFN